jgi:hypothetical protein
MRTREPGQGLVTHGGRLATYSSSTETGAPFTAMPLCAPSRLATVRFIDAVLADVRAQRNELPRVLPADYAAHLQAVIRLVDRDALGRKRPRYHPLGPDDYLHSEVFDWVAWRLLLWEAEYAQLRQWSLPELVSIEEALPGFIPSSLASYGDVDYYPGGLEPGLDDRYDW